MRILILNEDFRINDTSAGIVSSNFIEALVRTYDVTVLYDFDYQKENIIWFSRQVPLKPVTYSVPSPWWQKIPKIRAMPTYIRGYDGLFAAKIRAWKSSVEQELKANAYDLIITLGTGSSFAPFYAMLDINTDIPWLAHFHDPYPFSWYPEPYRQKSGWINRKKEKYARSILQKADRLSFPSLFLKEWMEQFVPEIKHKSIILPHIHSSLQNLPGKDTDREVSLPEGKFNILHAGSLLGPRKVEGLFNAFIQLAQEDRLFAEKAVLTVLGKVAREHRNIEEAITSFHSNFRIITRRVSYKRSLELSKQADLMLVIEARAQVSPFFPGKMADILYEQKPVLALTPPKSEVRRVLGPGYPYIATVDDEEKIYTALKTAWEQWKNGKLVLPDAGRLKDYVSPENFIREFNRMIETLGK